MRKIISAAHAQTQALCIAARNQLCTLGQPQTPARPATIP